MSMRTIVEFNHDCGDAIERNPAGFVDAITRMINGGSGARGVTRDLEYFGVKVTPTMHHSDDRKLVTKFAEYDF